MSGETMVPVNKHLDGCSGLLPRRSSLAEALPPGVTTLPPISKANRIPVWVIEMVVPSAGSRVPRTFWWWAAYCWVGRLQPRGGDRVCCV